MSIRAENDRQFDKIADRLCSEDTDLISRTCRLCRRELVHVAAVCALLVAAVFLLAAGLALQSPVAWCGGGLAFTAAPAVDRLLRLA